MLASSGEITDPCPVPFSLTFDHPVFEDAPAFNHFWIRRMMRGSPIRCSKKRISHSWLFSSKNVRMLRFCRHCSSPSSCHDFYTERVQRIMRAASRGRNPDTRTRGSSSP